MGLGCYLLQMIFNRPVTHIVNNRSVKNFVHNLTAIYKTAPKRICTVTSKHIFCLDNKTGNGLGVGKLVLDFRTKYRLFSAPIPDKTWGLLSHYAVFSLQLQKNSENLCQVTEFLLGLCWLPLWVPTIYITSMPVKENLTIFNRNYEHQCSGSWLSSRM